MAEISTARTVWIRQYQNLCEIVPSPPGLGQQSVYPTSRDLENAIIGRIKRERNWRSPGYCINPTLNIHAPQSYRSKICLVGDRWLFVLHHDAEKVGILVSTYDNQNSAANPRTLVDPSVSFKNVVSLDTILVDVDHSKPQLTFHLCAIVACWKNGPLSRGLIVYRLAQSGQGLDAELTVTKVNSFMMPMQGANAWRQKEFLCGRYYLRYFHPSEGSWEAETLRYLGERLEVYDWVTSTSDVHSMAFVDVTDSMLVRSAFGSGLGTNVANYLIQ